jgi:hypothetical protein
MEEYLFVQGTNITNGIWRMVAKKIATQNHGCLLEFHRIRTVPEPVNDFETLGGQNLKSISID